MKIDNKKPRHWLLLVQQLFYAFIAICVRPFRKKPEKPIVLLYGHQFCGNLKALYQQWEETHNGQLSLHFMSLDPDHANQLELEGIRVLRCDRSADMMALAGASVIITDHGLHMMAPLLYLTNIVFIDVWHGIPFKGFTPKDFKLQHRYDEIWVSSPLLKSIYENRLGFSADRVISLGYARTDKLFNNLESTFKVETSIPPENKIVLYAPTWQQDEVGRDLFPFDENQDSFIDEMARTCRDHSATLVVRGHMNTRINGNTYDNVRYFSQNDFPDTECILLATDLLICDWSSIAFDFLALNRPTIFVDVPPPFKNGFTLGKEYRFGAIAQNMSQLIEKLDRTLENPAQYHCEKSAAHNKVTSEVYGESTIGLASKNQLNRLVKIVENAQ